MKFLIDAQLPPALARFLTESGHEAVHVVLIGLERGSDHEIWNHALQMGAVLISKDEDFALMRTRNPVGPCVILVRIGNTTRRDLIKRFSTALPQLIAALEQGENLVELTD